MVTPWKKFRANFDRKVLSGFWFHSSEMTNSHYLLIKGLYLPLMYERHSQLEESIGKISNICFRYRELAINESLENEVAFRREIFRKKWHALTLKNLSGECFSNKKTNK